MRQKKEFNVFIDIFETKKLFDEQLYDIQQII